jgi:mono/diheme cytochrome c family protein
MNLMDLEGHFQPGFRMRYSNKSVIYGDLLRMWSSHKGKSQSYMPVLVILSVLAILVHGKGTSAQSGAKPVTPPPAMVQVIAPPWVAPASSRDVKNPVPVNPKTLADGAKLFHENCEPCHGPKGMGDGDTGKLLPIKPANFTDPVLMAPETDGTLFWKISKGLIPMPTWEDELKVEERWKLVNYIRQLGKNAAASNSK